MFVFLPIKKDFCSLFTYSSLVCVLLGACLNHLLPTVSLALLSLAVFLSLIVFPLLPYLCLSPFLSLTFCITNRLSHSVSLSRKRTHSVYIYISFSSCLLFFFDGLSFIIAANLFFALDYWPGFFLMSKKSLWPSSMTGSLGYL